MAAMERDFEGLFAGRLLAAILGASRAGLSARPSAVMASVASNIDRVLDVGWLVQSMIMDAHRTDDER